MCALRGPELRNRSLWATVTLCFVVSTGSNTPGCAHIALCSLWSVCKLCGHWFLLYLRSSSQDSASTFCGRPVISAWGHRQLPMPTAQPPPEFFSPTLPWTSAQCHQFLTQLWCLYLAWRPASQQYVKAWKRLRAFPWKVVQWVFSFFATFCQSHFTASRPSPLPPLMDLVLQSSHMLQCWHWLHFLVAVFSLLLTLSSLCKPWADYPHFWLYMPTSLPSWPVIILCPVV